MYFLMKQKLKYSATGIAVIIDEGFEALIKDTLYQNMGSEIFIINELLKEPTGKQDKSEPQMGFEPATLCNSFGCSKHRATGDFVASKGEMWVPLGSISNSFHIYHSHICSFGGLKYPCIYITSEAPENVGKLNNDIYKQSLHQTSRYP